MAGYCTLEVATLLGDGRKVHPIQIELDLHTAVNKQSSLLIQEIKRAE
jgi:hypothetical protein